MAAKPSARLLAIAEALPLTSGMRVLEIGCGPGVLARLVAARIGSGRVLGIDRSESAIEAARAGAAASAFAGIQEFRTVAAEDFMLKDGEAPYDLAVAIRVGALEGRHPQAGMAARARIAKALRPHARLFIDGGDPLCEIALDRDH